MHSNKKKLFLKKRLDKRKIITAICSLILFLGSVIYEIVNTVSIAMRSVYGFSMVSMFFGIIIVAIYQHHKCEDGCIFSPLLYSLIFIIGSVGFTIFLIRIMQKFITHENLLIEIFAVSLAILISTLCTYLILKLYLNEQDNTNIKSHYKTSNSWFNFTFFTDVFKVISSLFTIFACITFLLPDDNEKYLFAFMSTILCFYSLCLNFVFYIYKKLADEQSSP